MTNYLQEMSAVFRIKVELAFGFGFVFEKFSFVSDFIGNFFAFLYPMDCIYQNFILENVAYTNLMFLLILYPFIIFLIFLFWTILGFLSKKNVKDRRTSSIILISFMMQTSFINAFLKYLTCVEIDGQSYLKIHLKEKCWVESHIFYSIVFIVPFLFFWVVAFPLSIFLTLYRKQQMKGFDVVRKCSKFSFFTDGLKSKYYYWEILLMFKKYILIILSVFPLSDKMLFNVFFMMIFCFISMLFQIRQNPYEFQQASKISTFMNCLILASTIFMCMMLLFDSFANQIFVITVFLISNVLLYLKWALDIYKVKKQDIESYFNVIATKFKQIIKRFFDDGKNKKQKQKERIRKTAVRFDSIMNN